MGPGLGRGANAENHLPGAMFPMDAGVVVHPISQVGLIRDGTIDIGDQMTGLPQQPEMVGIDRQPAAEGI